MFFLRFGGSCLINLVPQLSVLGANTGMRTIEARNLRWRGVDVRIDKQGRRFCCLNVRGKNKYRELVAPDSVATYFERIKEISNATGPDDPVFSTLEGKSSSTLMKDDGVKAVHTRRSSPVADVDDAVMIEPLGSRPLNGEIETACATLVVHGMAFFT